MFGIVLLFQVEARDFLNRCQPSSPYASTHVFSEGFGVLRKLKMLDRWFVLPYFELRHAIPLTMMPHDRGVATSPMTNIFSSRDPQFQCSVIVSIETTSPTFAY